MWRFLVVSRLTFLQILYLSLEKCPSRGIIMRAGLLAIIYHRCNVGNLTQTKMDVEPASPLVCMKMRLILVSLQTSNLLECPHPQSAGTTKSQRRVGTRKRPKKNQN